MAQGEWVHAVVRRLHELSELPQWVPEQVVNVWELSRSGSLGLEEETVALARPDHPEFYLLWDRENEWAAVAHHRSSCTQCWCRPCWST